MNFFNIAAVENLDVQDLLKEVIEESKEDIIRLNRDRLQNKGEDYKGRTLSPGYAASTKKRKRRRGQTTKHVTLRDSSDMYESIYVEVDREILKVSSDVEYLKYLEGKYGGDILGMSSEDMKTLKITERVTEKVRLKLIEAFTPIDSLVIA